jgi:hypothetical protein
MPGSNLSAGASTVLMISSFPQFLQDNGGTVYQIMADFTSLPTYYPLFFLTLNAVQSGLLAEPPNEP